MSNEPKNCIFCDRLILKRKGLIQRTCTTNSEKKINQINKILENQKLGEKACGLKNISYHPSCLGGLEYKLFKRSTPKTKSIWSNTRNIHSTAFEKLEKLLVKELIDENEVKALSDIFNLYKAILEEEKLKEPDSHDEHTSTLKPHHLQQKILQKIPSITTTSYKHRVYLHKMGLSLDVILAKGFENKSDINKQIRSIAFFIRQKVLSMPKRTLPKNNVTLQDVLNGECDIPGELRLLIGYLIKGPNGSDTPSKENRILSICSSIIFSLSNGSIKPALCLDLGLVTKSITGSRKMLNILNRMGHSISYTVTEEIETELAYGCSSEKRILPHGLQPRSPHLHTHLAFDNFDKFVETSSGKDTLHDTVGIVFQNYEGQVEGQVCEEQNGEEHAINESQIGDKRRRKFVSSFNSVIEPYLKTNQGEICLVGNLPIVPENLQQAHYLNNIWMLHHVLNAAGAQRWFEFNSERVVDQNPIHKIAYLPNINMSPTSDAVVKKTLEIAKSIAVECRQQHIITTYDLAIACKAYRIQADLSPEFDEVFITLGAFHTEMSYFKV